MKRGLDPAFRMLLLKNSESSISHRPYGYKAMIRALKVEKKSFILLLICLKTGGCVTSSVDPNQRFDLGPFFA